MVFYQNVSFTLNDIAPANFMIQTKIHHLTIEFMINFKMILSNRE